MPNLGEHQEACSSQGIDTRICTVVNRWMDQPSTDYPGCSHRQFRHGDADCIDLAGNVIAELSRKCEPDVVGILAAEVYCACQIHRQLDRANEACGCKALYEEYLSAQREIPANG